jgi:hypothetical protein
VQKSVAEVLKTLKTNHCPGDEHRPMPGAHGQVDQIQVFSKYILYQVQFTTDPAVYEKLWKVRRIVHQLPQACRYSLHLETCSGRCGADTLADLGLISRYGYTGSVIWGHIMDGNIHL